MGYETIYSAKSYPALWTSFKTLGRNNSSIAIDCYYMVTATNCHKISGII